MKRIIAVITCVALLSGCTYKEEIKISNEDNYPEEEIVEEIPKYIDDNNTKIGIYLYENGKYNLVTTYMADMVESKDIVIFDIYPSNELHIEKNNYIENLYNIYTSLSNYELLKIGFNLKYTLSSGEEISYNMVDSDSALRYDLGHIYAWFYDDYKHRYDSFYSHIEQSEYSDSLVTSIKLYNNNTKDIASKIVLTVFTYDGEDDFDENGEYRGNSSYSIYICDKNRTCD